ncbi:molybdopterin molybdotransferase MoeA [Shinella zoogloeoides]|uniref:Molybdopterin molybdenumtransferase n=1 Tax=Shinella zoogloeoides TaxID=352475 RepID=A0A6N8T6W0_SHIZO|nr:gephyrin-like molybdotransferase Glp [Shinella zoogloeoides]MXN98728.1 molybdopterin molybdenumtransferase MoeA [Shinella zoogloeoides]UEX83182.1 molybdopterin molybdotransferase MoeA [Shinella zoogloeoides]
MSLLPVADALERLLCAARPVRRTEKVPLHQAEGRVLAEDVAARLTQPPFDNSAMDGYALRHADIPALGSVLKVVGTSAAGHAFEGGAGPGEAVRIFTGAPLPAFADTVLLQEDAEVLEDGRIRTTFLTPKGRHIRPRGQDFHEGEVVLKAGDVLDPGRLTVAAAMNHPELTVYTRPRVALLATGDELVPPGTPPGASQIIASNTYGVAAIARSAGADIVDLGIVRDDKQAILDAVRNALSLDIDVLVTLGGASVGDFDLVQPVLGEAGMELDFWRIAMRPGKPLMVGRLGEIQVVGLPGNPVSSLVCSLLFLEPLVRRLSHLPPKDRLRDAVAAVPVKENDHRQDYVRARVTRGPAGELLVTPFGKQDSSMMKTFAEAEGLLVRPPQAPAMAAGSPCKVLLLREPTP